MTLEIEEISRLFLTLGTMPHHGSDITLLQHALQCAHHAQSAGSPPALVAAALLHDLGRLLAAYAEDDARQLDDGHRYVVIALLRGRYPSDMLLPIGLMPEAKRYLSSVDPAFWASLPASARHSVAARGGRLSASQAAVFIRQPQAREAVKLVQWDLRSQDPAACPAEWGHYLPLLHQLERGSSGKAP